MALTREADSRTPFAGESVAAIERDLFSEQETLLTKFVLFWCGRRNIPVRLRGSSLDGEMVSGLSERLLAIQSRLNRLKMSDILHHFPGDLPDNDLYPPPRGKNLKIVTDAPDLLKQLYLDARSVLGWPETQQIGLPIIRSDGNGQRHGYDFVHETLVQPPHIPVIWFREWTELEAANSFPSPFTGVPPHARYITQELDITLESEADPDRRHPDTCLYNLDKLRGEMYLNVVNSEMSIANPDFVAQLNAAEVIIKRPDKPTNLEIDQIVYHNLTQQMAEGDTVSAEIAIEQTIRLLRKVGVIYKPRVSKTVSLQIHELMDRAIPLFLKSSYRDPTLIEGMAGEIKASAEDNPHQTLSLIYHWGLYQLFFPDVQRAFSSREAIARMHWKLARNLKNKYFKLPILPNRLLDLEEAIAWEATGFYLREGDTLGFTQAEIFSVSPQVQRSFELFGLATPVNSHF